MRTSWFKILLLAGVLVAQGQDVIRVQTRLVEIDVVVRNKGGAVAGLTKDDFTLFDDGRPRKIDLFAMTAATPEQNKTVVAPRSLNVAVNRVVPEGDQEQTATVILVDRLNTAIADQVYAKQQLSAFFHSQWNGEPTAIYTLDSALHVIQEFSNDPKRLNAAASALGPAQSFSGGIEDRVRKTLASWTTIAHHVAITPGRKNLVWLSSGFPRCIRDGRVAVCFDDDIARAARVLNDSRVALYPIDVRGFRAPAYVARPRGYTTPDFSPTLADISIDTFADAARLTGGMEFHDTNSIQGAIRQAMDDSEVVYTLGFYLSDTDLDGAFHKIKVDVSRKGVDLRYRPGYMAAKDLGLAPEQRRKALSEALFGSLQSSAIGLRATATAAPGTPGSYQLVVSIDAHDIHFEQFDKTWTSAFEASVTWEPSPPDKVTTEPVPIVLTDDQFQDALKRSLLWRKTISVGTKAKTLRVVIQDQATGAVGSVSIPLKTN